MRYGISARIEDRSLDAVQAVVNRVFDWLPRVEAYTGIGSPTKVRVMCRIVLSPFGPVQDRPRRSLRGFRPFVVLPADQEQVEIRIGEQTVLTVSDRGGYVDQEIVPLEPLEPGWHTVRFTATRSGYYEQARIVVVSPTASIGVISDIDDTAIVTAVPQVALAVWNTFIQKITNRQPVTGMPSLFQAIVAAYSQAPVIYLSNGAWNTARNLRKFLHRFEFPFGPLLLTDFGPTDTGFFRSGKQHKRNQIKWLMETFPNIGWFLVGDDGQHDPDLYVEAAHQYPGRVGAIGIRTLSPMQRMMWLKGTRPAAVAGKEDIDVPFIEAHTGDEMLSEFRALGLLP
jgi:phosphatidate phosphatase APP1